MTTSQLRKTLNDEFGINKWPSTYEVSLETYANVCQSIFKHQFDQEDLYWDTASMDKSDVKILSIAVGKANKGIMFKNVELILTRG